MKAEYESDKEWMSYLQKLLGGQVLNMLHINYIDGYNFFISWETIEYLEEELLSSHYTVQKDFQFIKARMVNFFILEGQILPRQAD